MVRYGTYWGFADHVVVDSRVKFEALGLSISLGIVTFAIPMPTSVCVSSDLAEPSFDERQALRPIFSVMRAAHSKCSVATSVTFVDYALGLSLSVLASIVKDT
jgi:hypothetical protein